ncbi:MAG: DUF952 domain-containing protein [Oscillospiraceae bacterium]|nr:DUF952 domain-containing protein [Oscillospiraceae bacterium]
MILHCMKKATWDERKNKPSWGKRNIEEGFIHCSTVEYFWRVAPNFIDVEDELVLLCIDEEKLISEVRYEDGDNCGRAYPHVYGLINNSAVINVLPFLKNEDGTYKKNHEFADIEDK